MKGTTAVSTVLKKNKISSACAKIRQFVGKSVARRKKNLFRYNQAQLFKELGGNGCKTEATVPNEEEAREFWSRIWSEEKEHNWEASWLDEVRESFAGVGKQRGCGDTGGCHCGD